MNALVLAAMVMAACSGGHAAPDASDARALDAPGPDPNLFGETCAEAPFPELTVCRDWPTPGWCVAGTCRPQCGPSPGPACRVGLQRLSDRLACYCAPE